MKRLSLLFKYLISTDYRDYRKIRIRHVFDSDYFERLLLKLRPELHEDYGGFEDPLWAYFVLSRKELTDGKLWSGGWRQLLDPHPLFDTWHYLSRYREEVGSRNPLAHYLLSGWEQGLQPGPFFDADHYAGVSRWGPADGDPLSHCIHHGLPAGISPAGSFDTDWYMDQSPYPEGVRSNAVKHYKLHGAFGGKSPVPVFSPSVYLDSLADEDNAKNDPFLHYLCTGEAAGLAASSTFDSAFYSTRHRGAGDRESSLLHYLTVGVHREAVINKNVDSLVNKPVISVIVPVYNPDPRYLRNCIRSVLYQSYPWWELVLVDDCSEHESIRDELRTWSATDSRITCLFNDQNQGIAGATQVGVDAASGDFVGFLDNDDELATDCLHRFVQEIHTTGGKVFYSDEDLVGDDGSHHSTFYKPDFNRALLYSHNYITHFVVVSRPLLLEVGGVSREVDGAQDYDLILTLADSGETIYHIPEVLYHWRAVETSTSIAHGQKPYAHEAGKQALEESLQRQLIAATVHDGPVNFHYRIALTETSLPSVSVFVHREALDRISEATDYPHASFHAIGHAQNDNTETSPDFPGAHATEDARLLQDRMATIEDEYIAVLAHEFTTVNSLWLHELVTKRRLDEQIGIVCGRVSYDGTDGPSFAEADLACEDAIYYTDFIVSASRHAQGLHNLQWVNACDGSICLISRSVIDRVGGIDFHRFPSLLPIVELSYRIVAAGYRILYTPDAVATVRDYPGHRLVPGNEAQKEVEFFQSRHSELLLRFECFYNSGRITEKGYERERFYRWLTGADCKEPLTERAI